MPCAQLISPPTGERPIWRTFSRRCQLFPLADSLIGQNSSHGVSPAKILFIGDSTDRLIQQDVCLWGAAVGSPTHNIGFLHDQVTLQVREPALWLRASSTTLPAELAACRVPDGHMHSVHSG